VELERRGIPTATLCTDEFGALARTEAEALGIETLPIVFLPHPLGGLDEAAVRAKADTVLAEVLHVLTGAAETLAEQYRGAYPPPKSTVRPKPVFT
jgi:hypothetical protein